MARDSDPFKLDLVDGGPVRAKTVVIASGAAYRRPPIENSSMFEGAGVSYWASPVEAKLCAGEEVALIGGGNSAGQAVVFLAPKVRQLHLVVRREGLEATMSRYLIERISALPNVELHTHTEIVGLEGDAVTGLTGARFRDKRTREEHSCSMRHLFLFCGADPNAGWLDGCVALDDKGFVLTGAKCSERGGRPVLPLGDQPARRVRHRRCASRIDQARRGGGGRRRRGRCADSQRAGRGIVQEQTSCACELPSSPCFSPRWHCPGSRWRRTLRQGSPAAN